MITFTYVTRSVASVSDPRLQGARAVGAYRLDFSFTLLMQPLVGAKADLVSTQITGELAVRDVLLAHLAPVTGFWIAPDGHAQPHAITMGALLTGDQVRALDGCRGADGSIDVMASLSTTFQGDKGARSSSCKIGMSVSPSDRLAMLERMGWERRVTIEVPVEGVSIVAALAKPGAHLSKALAHLDALQWVAAVAECREVADALALIAPPVAGADWKDVPQFTAWDVTQRIAFATRAIRHTTHPAHHQTPQMGTIDEASARSIVNMTALVFADAVRRSRP